jgi:hypothetical protein
LRRKSPDHLQVRREAPRTGKPPMAETSRCHCNRPTGSATGELRAKIRDWEAILTSASSTWCMRDIMDSVAYGVCGRDLQTVSIFRLGAHSLVTHDPGLWQSLLPWDESRKPVNKTDRRAVLQTCVATRSGPLPEPRRSVPYLSGTEAILARKRRKLADSYCGMGLQVARLGKESRSQTNLG